MTDSSNKMTDSLTDSFTDSFETDLGSFSSLTDSSDSFTRKKPSCIKSRFLPSLENCFLFWRKLSGLSVIRFLDSFATVSHSQDRGFGC